MSCIGPSSTAHAALTAHPALNPFWPNRVHSFQAQLVLTGIGPEQKPGPTANHRCTVHLRGTGMAGAYLGI